MKKQSIFYLFVLLIGMVGCVGKLGSENGNATATVSTIKADEFERQLSAHPDAQLIDVRTPEEFERGHLQNAVNIDVHGKEFENMVEALDKERPVMVYCKSGGRSADACEQLRNLGFKNIYGLDGGMMAWTQAGKPLAASEAVQGNAGMTQADIEKLAAGKKYALVDYNAKWCGPCKKMMPILDGIASKRKDSLLLVKVDADENGQLMQQKGVTGIPYMELYKDGKLVWTYTGMISEEQLIAQAGL